MSLSRRVHYRRFYCIAECLGLWKHALEVYTLARVSLDSTNLLPKSEWRPVDSQCSQTVYRPQPALCRECREKDHPLSLCLACWDSASSHHPCGGGGERLNSCEAALTLHDHISGPKHDTIQVTTCATRVNPVHKQ